MARFTRTVALRVRSIRTFAVAAAVIGVLALGGCTTGAVPGFDGIEPEQTAAAAPPPPPSSPSPDPSPDETAPPTAVPTPPPCTATTMSVWAHPDDDLLFLQTVIGADIAAGNCVRTVFLTSGDAGRGADYSNGREAGLMRAYDVMRGASTPWAAQSVTLSTGAQTTVWQPADDPRLSIVFFHLPDGNLYGQGYPATGELSLAKLAADKILTIPSVGGAYQLSWGQIVDSLRELVGQFAPTTLHTHVPGSAQRWAKGDHADHAITGILGRAAWQAAGLPESLVRYAVGYQTVEYPPNLAGPLLESKIAAFRAYAAGDSVVIGCHDDASCLALPRFGDWLQREYTRTEAELWQ
ncbi:PIG-L family deacetylase [Microbacterium sp. zg.B48]|uniref:PIG-L family deacetylase n=1 Tax=Microbacterium sp. zg.B48 TaxID=2969408 RepID=UPI00214A9478|nr:PIG-L family deacetylase [Microbacterium sp. zg.B48]MCR2765181.1 PIG-L family deacetylase [Microbacterium sp. zg.B48]